MEHTLLLNATYEPLRVVPWRKAITLWSQGKVEIVAVYDREIRSVSFSIKLPSVIRLLRRIRVRRRTDYVPFSRANIYARDHYKCQYCGVHFSAADLTFDHVVPVALGGRKDWENIVTCCITCNRRKGGRTPEQAGMHLIRHPRRPEKLCSLNRTRAAVMVSASSLRWPRGGAARPIRVAERPPGSSSICHHRAVKAADICDLVGSG